MGQITIDDLNFLVDLKEARNQVSAALDECMTTPEDTLRFMHCYVSWNGFFGPAVATLAGKVGRCRKMFLDETEPITALADRSNLVASYFFDAARDEFDDQGTEHRDTHRCLAQAMLKGSMAFYGIENPDFSIPLWLQGLNDRVAVGYGAGSPDDKVSVFRAIGYHLGSEILADKEFSVIDETLRKSQPDLVHYLENHTARIGEQDHQCYYWVAIHSGHDGAVEMEHFEYAMKGARLALRFSPEHQRDDLRHQMLLGFRDFAQDHEEFFNNIVL